MGRILVEKDVESAVGPNELMNLGHTAPAYLAAKATRVPGIVDSTRSSSSRLTGLTR